MKKIKLNDCYDLVFSLNGIKYIEVFCPVNKGFCNKSCAWFDIEEQVKVKDKINEYGILERPINVIVKIVTCKGTPIAELVEDGN